MKIGWIQLLCILGGLLCCVAATSAVKFEFTGPTKIVNEKNDLYRPLVTDTYTPNEWFNNKDANNWTLEKLRNQSDYNKGWAIDEERLHLNKSGYYHIRPLIHSVTLSREIELRPVTAVGDTGITEDLKEIMRRESDLKGESIASSRSRTETIGKTFAVQDMRKVSVEIIEVSATFSLSASYTTALTAGEERKIYAEHTDFNQLSWGVNQTKGKYVTIWLFAGGGNVEITVDYIKGPDGKEYIKIEPPHVIQQIGQFSYGPVYRNTIRNEEPPEIDLNDFDLEMVLNKWGIPQHA